MSSFVRSVGHSAFVASGTVESPGAGAPSVDDSGSGEAVDRADGLSPAPWRPSTAMRVRRLARSLHNRERLGRLRRELARIHPPPASPEEARGEIVNALARAGLGDWTVPGLEDESTLRHASGTFRISLLAHVILLNPSGAFRITDLHAQAVPYFEMRGLDGRAFVLPAGLPLKD